MDKASRVIFANGRLGTPKFSISQLATNRIGLPGKLIKWFTFLI